MKLEKKYTSVAEFGFFLFCFLSLYLKKKLSSNLEIGCVQGILNSELPYCQFHADIKSCVQNTQKSQGKRGVKLTVCWCDNRAWLEAVCDVG